MNSLRNWFLPACAVVLLALPAAAQNGVSEASGQVVDQDGEALSGARVVLTPGAHPDTHYDGKTNKKGRYFIPGLWTAKEDDEWTVEIELEGFALTKVRVESRNANRVLMRDPWEQEIKPGQALPPLKIRPLGSIKIDFTMAPADQIAATPAPAAAETMEALPVGGAEADGTAASAAAPPAPSRDPWEDALSAAGAGDSEGAVPLLRKAIEKQPESLERRETLAKVLYQLKRYDEASEEARAAVALQPDSPDSVGARMVLYSVQVAQDDFGGARETLEAARAADPSNTRVLDQLAFVAGKAGDTGAAIEAYEAITVADPGAIDAWLNLADLYAAAGDDEKSRQAYEQVIQLDPKNAHQIFYNLGALKFNKQNASADDMQEAIAAFRKAVEIKPGYAQAHKQLAFALLSVGDRAAARGELERYVELAPNATDAAQVRSMIETLKH